MNLSEILYENLGEMIPANTYPKEHIVPITARLGGAAFFPLGDGLYKAGDWKKEEHFPIMVLAQDCGNEAEAAEVLNTVSQSEMAYGNVNWLCIQKLLGEEAMQDCFFTTAIMGLRSGETKTSGASYAFHAKAQEFLGLNQSFFELQLEEADPDVIIALGLPVCNFLSLIFPKQLQAFSKVKTQKDLDELCPKGFVDLMRDGNPLRIVFIGNPDKTSQIKGLGALGGVI